MEDDQGQYLAKALQSTFNPPYSYPSRFPRIVWQTASEHGREKYAENAETWKKVQGFQYNFLTGKSTYERSPDISSLASKLLKRGSRRPGR
jgi:hypothetical protein